MVGIQVFQLIALMKTPEDIIDKYKEVSKNIEGVISL